MEVNNLIEYLKGNVFINTSYIFLASLVGAASGFVFWIIGARLFSPDTIGIATSLLSATSLVVLVTKLGLNQTVIKYNSEFNSNTVYTTVLLLTTGAALIGAILLALLNGLVQLKFLKNMDLVASFIIISVFSSAIGTNSQMFLANDSTKNFFFQNILVSTRIFLIIPLSAISGILGLLSAFSITYGYTFLFTSIMLYRQNVRISLPSREFISSVWKFSGANYISSILVKSTDQIMPILVLSILSPAAAGLYYITFTISSVVFKLPESLGTSIFIEGSSNDSANIRLLPLSILFFVILVAGTSIVVLFGKQILGLFQQQYVSAYTLLVVLISCSPLILVVSIYLSLLRIRNDLKEIIIVSGTRFFVQISSAYLFMNEYGLIGVGYSFVVTYAVITALIAMMELRKNNWIKKVCAI